MHNKLRVVIFGPPASGKGTVSSLLANEIDALHFDVGSHLRSNIKDQTLLSLINSGICLSDDKIISIIKPQLSERHIIFDGFPRSLGQTEYLLAQPGIHIAFEIKLPLATALQRIQSRVVCGSCGRSGSVSDLVCKCGAENWRTRIDDNPETLTRRHKHYDAQIQPMLDFWKANNIPLYQAPADQNPEKLCQTIKSLLPQDVLDPK